MENKTLDNLNKLTKLEFIKNYDKSEVQRMFEKDTEEMKQLKEDIKSELEKLYNTNEYKVEVTTSCINILQKVNENTFTLKESVFSDNFYKLPYGYVMGRKLSKKAMQETLKNM